MTLLLGWDAGVLWVLLGDVRYTFSYWGLSLENLLLKIFFLGFVIVNSHNWSPVVLCESSSFWPADSISLKFPFINFHLTQQWKVILLLYLCSQSTVEKKKKKRARESERRRNFREEFLWANSCFFSDWKIVNSLYFLANCNL